jgi:S1-C subfamily serine protease
MGNAKIAAIGFSVAVIGAAAGCTAGKSHTAPAAQSTGSASAAAAATGASAQTASNAAPAQNSATLTTKSTASRALGSTVDVVNAIRPSVVRVRTEESQVGAFGAVQGGSGTGTGVIYDSQGDIITNNHVVTLGTNSPASTFMVDLADGETVSAKLVGREPAADIAVLRIDAKNLTPAKFADPKSVEVGQDVVAIGYALDLGSTPSVTKGVVSALNREIDETLSGSGRQSAGTQNVVGGAIQTDAAINPGNSGGPLLDSHGSVIGINTAIYGPQGNIGLGFAMPINRAKPMLEEYAQNGKISRPSLGIQTVYISGDLAEELSLPTSGGLLIQTLERGSAAADAGLRGYTRVVIVGNYRLGIGGDLITAVEGQKVEGNDSLERALSRKRAGQTLNLTIYRNGRSQQVAVRLGEAPQTVL